VIGIVIEAIVIAYGKQLIAKTATAAIMVWLS